MATHVNAGNFARAETDRMFAGLQHDSGGINRLRHHRVPAPIDEQNVIRLNRDTLYSFALVDLSEGAELALPDPGERYLSAMVVNQDHYVNEILHEPGRHALSIERFDTPYVGVAVRTLVDPNDPDDVAQATALQDRIAVEAGSAVPFEAPDYDVASLDATRSALLALAAGMDDFSGAFGRRDEVDPVQHLLGTAAGWGGLPPSEARYLNVVPELPPGSYQLTLRDVPVDAFWSVSVYNAEGYFEPNPSGVYSVNSVTAVRDEDGAVTVRFVDPSDPGLSHAGLPNSIPTPPGWNLCVRLYRPRAEVRDGSWRLPGLEPAAG